jgi:hypothetical protein
MNKHVVPVQNISYIQRQIVPTDTIDAIIYKPKSTYELIEYNENINILGIQIEDEINDFPFPNIMRRKNILNSEDAKNICKFGVQYYLGSDWNPVNNISNIRMKSITINEMSNLDNTPNISRVVSDYSISANGVRYKNGRIIMYHGTSKQINLKNPSKTINRYDDLCENPNKALLDIYNYVSNDTVSINNISKGLFLTTNPGIAIKYAIPTCKKNESCDQYNITREEIPCKVGGIIIEFSLDPSLISGWAMRDYQCIQYRKSSPDTQTLTKKNEVYRNVGYDIMRDLELIYEYFIVNPDIFSDPSKIKIENVYDLQDQTDLNYFNGTRSVIDDQTKRVQHPNEC